MDFLRGKWTFVRKWIGLPENGLLAREMGFCQEVDLVCQEMDFLSGNEILLFQKVDLCCQEMDLDLFDVVIFAGASLGTRHTTTKPKKNGIRTTR
jgi:hypothetical protein